MQVLKILNSLIKWIKCLINNLDTYKTFYTYKNILNFSYNFKYNLLIVLIRAE